MMEFIKSLTVKDILAFIGAATIVLGFLELLFRIIPQFSNLRAKFWGFIARKWRHKKLEKRAIASDIENVVNEVVAELQTELPCGWITKVSIDWIDKDIKEEDLKDGEMILRIRPMESQDENLINGIYYFFAKALFPETKEVIPMIVRKSTALHLSRRSITDKKPFLANKFEKGILESSIKNEPNIVYFIDKFNEIDNKGFFTGSFLREIHEIASRSKFKQLRNQIDGEIKSVLEHIDDFVKNIHKNSSNDWSRKGPATSYAFLLVAQPFSWSVNPYVNRVKEHLNQGVERIYIMGTNRERKFVKNTISAITKLPSCHLVEIFELNRDYRGDRNGIGALFVKKDIVKEDADKKIENFFDKDEQKRNLI